MLKVNDYHTWRVKITMSSENHVYHLPSWFWVIATIFLISPPFFVILSLIVPITILGVPVELSPFDQKLNFFFVVDNRQTHVPHPFGTNNTCFYQAFRDQFVVASAIEDSYPFWDQFGAFDIIYSINPCPCSTFIQGESESFEARGYLSITSHFFISVPFFFVLLSLRLNGLLLQSLFGLNILPTLSWS